VMIKRSILKNYQLHCHKYMTIKSIISRPNDQNKACGDLVWPKRTLKHPLESERKCREPCFLCHNSFQLNIFFFQYHSKDRFSYIVSRQRNPTAHQIPKADRL
jgi:hypothetical protein